MKENSKRHAAILNPALNPLKTIIGEWKTAGTHPYAPGTILYGHDSFEWIEGGAFLIWHSEIEDDRFPKGTAIFGSDNTTGEYFLLYFDDRKISRKYDVSVQDNILKWSRNTPDFSQRYSWTFTNNGNNYW